MVNDAVNPEQELALSYARAQARAGLSALLALDRTLGGLLGAQRDPMVAQLRLAWWHEALTALDAMPPPAQPVLEALAREVLPAGVAGAELAAMVDGWEALLDPAPLDADRVAAHAEARGAALFAAAGRVLGAGAGDPLAAAGQGWALADLARRTATPAEAALAGEAARGWLATATASSWSRAGRALGALAHGARMDLAPGARPRGAPGRVARLLRHRLTGG